MEADIFWERVKQRLAKMGKTQEWLCSQTNTLVQTMRNRISTHRWPNVEDLLKIMEVFDTTIEKFLENPYSEEKANLLKIPLIDQTLSAGYGQFVPDKDEITDFITLPKNYLQGGKSYAAVYVRGDSMEPTLFDNDIIVCSLNGYDGSDEIYAIIDDGKGYVKRLQREENGISIISDNPKYKTRFKSAENTDGFKIIGKVECIISLK